MKEVNFEKYLEEMFLEEEPQTLDDDISEGFEKWLEGVDIQTIIDCGQEYAEKMFNLR